MMKSLLISLLVTTNTLLAPTSAWAQPSTNLSLKTPSGNPAINNAPVEPDKRVQSHGLPWRLARAKVTDVSRPHVLLVGDSILNGYLSYVVKALDGRAYVDAWVNPYYHSEKFNQLLSQVLTNGPYAVVHINLGLHGWQKGRIPPGQFEPLTRALISVIQEKCPNAKIIWATTTPIKTKGKPCRLDSELNPIIVEENRIAKKVMAEMHVQVDDLYSAIVGHLNLSVGDQFHWQSSGSRILATNVVESIEAALHEEAEQTRPSEKRSSAATAQPPRTPESAVTPTCSIPANHEQLLLSRHTNFLAMTNKADIQLLFLGDSITDWWPRNGRSSWAKLAVYHPADLGVMADRTEHLLWRITHGELGGMHPKVTVILIGVNNIHQCPDEKPQWVAAGIEKIVRTVHQELPETKVLLLGIFPAGYSPTDPQRQKILKVNQIISKLDDGNKTRYLDISKKFLEPDGILPKATFPGGLHPNERGYEIWYEAMQPLLSKMMAS